jgi:predicted nucleic acid-binding protein
MALEPAVLDTDTLSELSRGNSIVRARAAAYLAEFGRLTITAVTVFERLRGLSHVSTVAARASRSRARARGRPTGP